VSGAPITVVMSVYNGARFLDEAIHSIRGQTYRNFEFVIVDDGSTDATPEILARHTAEDSRIRVLSQENRGLVESLHGAFAVATGTYIARMDADDISKPSRLEAQLEFLDSNPGVVLVGGAIEIIDSESRVRKIVRPPLYPDELRRELREHGNALAHPAVMFRRQVLEEVGGFRRAYLYAEDYDLWLRMVEKSDLANLPAILLGYRRHEAAVSYRHIEQQALSALCARTTARFRLEGRPDPTSGVDLITEALLRNLGVAQKTIDEAIFNNVLFQVEDAIQSGVCSVAAQFARMARPRAPAKKVARASLELNGKAAEIPATISERREHRTMLLMSDPPTYWELFRPNREVNLVRRRSAIAGNAMFSVLVPVFNHATYVKQAVVSALRSPLVNEVIVVDDGSTDGSADILAELAGKHPDRIRNLTRNNQVNLGLHNRLNELVEAARCAWVGVLNGNDIFVDGRFEAILAEPSFAECEFVFGNLLLVDLAGRLIGAKRGPFDPAYPFPRAFNITEMVSAGNFLDLLAHQNHIGTTSNMVFTKALHARVGGFAPCRYVHDWDFALRALALGRCSYVRHYLTACRVTKSSMIEENSAEVSVESRILFDRLLKEFPHLAERSNFQIGLRENASLVRMRAADASVGANSV
jgi:glycosyltransferase involved in cell wall biosynthesis